MYFWGNLIVSCSLSDKKKAQKRAKTKKKNSQKKNRHQYLRSDRLPANFLIVSPIPPVSPVCIFSFFRPFTLSLAKIRPGCYPRTVPSTPPWMSSGIRYGTSCGALDACTEMFCRCTFMKATYVDSVVNGINRGSNSIDFRCL